MPLMIMHITQEIIMRGIMPISEIDKCKDWIEGALKYSGGTHDYADIIRGIKQNKMQLWPAKDLSLIHI